MGRSTPGRIILSFENFITPKIIHFVFAGLLIIALVTLVRG